MSVWLYTSFGTSHRSFQEGGVGMADAGNLGRFDGLADTIQRPRYEYSMIRERDFSP